VLLCTEAIGCRDRKRPELFGEFRVPKAQEGQRLRIRRRDQLWKSSQRKSKGRGPWLLENSSKDQKKAHAQLGSTAAVRSDSGSL
jgi:predicted RNA-binding protein YlxR (DUF448 family)